MTQDQTRQLGIEFERRVQAIDPTTEVAGKMDTDDIYSYLNQYQLQYVKSLYVADGQAESQTRQSYKIQDILKPLIKESKLLEPVEANNSNNKAYVVDLPSDYYSYIRSVSHITSDYEKESTDAWLPNIMLKQEDAQKVIEASYDNGRILRNPVCVIAQKDGNKYTMDIIRDRYTTIDGVNVWYITKPAQFGWDGEKIVPCDLPYDCFEDLVTGAVELYFGYKYKVTLASQAARRNAARQELGTDKQPQQTQEAES